MTPLRKEIARLPRDRRFWRTSVRFYELLFKEGGNPADAAKALSTNSSSSADDHAPFQGVNLRSCLFSLIKQIRQKLTIFGEPLKICT
jgi:hypothetical protein